MDPEGEDRHLARLKRVKAERDQAAWSGAMERLEAASKDGKSNTMPLIIDAVNAGATVGEICNMWRRVFGEYKEQVVV
jgi:methylmalonyl-CoA mutase N-terminal domain/subunit